MTTCVMDWGGRRPRRAAVCILACTAVIVAAGPGSLQVRAVVGRDAGVVSGPVTEYPLTHAAYAQEMTIDHHGNIWFTEGSAESIGMIDQAGNVHEYPLITRNPASEIGSGPYAIATAPDGSIWFINPGIYDSETTIQLGRIDGDGTITRYITPWPWVGGTTNQMAFDSSGNLWIAASTAVVKVTLPSSVPTPAVQVLTVNVYPVTPNPTGAVGFGLPDLVQAITIASDGSVWFGGGAIVGHMSTSGTLMAEYPLDALTVVGMASGPGGDIWVSLTSTSSHNGHEAILRISPDGKMTTRRIPDVLGYWMFVYGITVGGDGTVWFAESVSLAPENQAFVAEIGRLDSCGMINQYRLPSSGTQLPAGIVWGVHDTVWVPDAYAGDFVAKVDTHGLGFPSCHGADQAQGHAVPAAEPSRTRLAPRHWW